MRFIIAEQAYEQPLARGLWRYTEGGRPTGTVEQWRLSAAQDGFYFLRVDLDARAAPGGRSYLYHAVLDARLQPLRLQVRLWQGSKEVRGNIHLEPESALLTSGQGADRREDTLALPAGYRFWFPASASLALLARTSVAGPAPAMTLDLAHDEDHAPLIRPLVTTLSQNEGRDAANGQRFSRLAWENQQRTLWFDEQDWPVRIQRQNDLEAVEGQLVRTQRIHEPGGVR